MAADFTIKRGSRRPALAVTLSDAAGAINLSAASGVRLVMRRVGESTPALDVAMTPDPNQTTNPGKVSYAWSDGNTDAAGDYDAEFVITWNDGAEQRVPNRGAFTIAIVSDLGALTP